MSLHEWPAYARIEHPALVASGSELVLGDGRSVLDLYGGHCVNTLGAGHEGLLDAISTQWRSLSFTTNLLDHATRGRFLDAFEPNLPPGDWSVFLSNSGSEANENALKAALLATGRRAVVCFDGAFHGRTAGAAAVSDAKFPSFPSTPFEVRRVPFGDADAAAGAIDGDVGAVIVEPIQSLAGVIDPPPGFLAALRDACDRAGALLVFDEVQTGNGRLGVPWASQHFDVVPDLFTTAKGAAGGLPIGVTVATNAVVDRVPGGHFGSTFGGGPTVLAAATVIARAVGAPDHGERVTRCAEALREASMKGPVTGIRGAGLLLGLELDEDVSAVSVRDALLERGILVGLCCDPRVLRLSPPLDLDPARAAALGDALAQIDCPIAAPETTS